MLPLVTTTTPRLTLAPLPAELEARLRTLLGMRVSDVLEEVPGALELLVDHGFGPLAQPAMRRLLAPTVTLRQALAMRALPTWREEAALRALAELAGRDARGREASCP